jgi:hypothetical protein
VLDGRQVYVLSSYETNSIAPGAVYWRTNTASVPVTTSGSYYFIFQTDSGNTLAESDYANNTQTVPVTFTISRSDLKPIYFSAPSAVTGAPDPSVTLVIGVTNQGAGAALAAYDAVYISATPARDSSARLVATWSRTNATAPGQTYWLTNTVRLPVGDSGNYYLIFEADTYRVLEESAPLNNVASVPIRLQLSLQPDLVLLDFRFPSELTGSANPTVQVSWQIANQGLGQAVAPWFDTLLFYTNLSYGPPVVLNSSLETNPLPVSDIYTRTISLTLPVSQGGTYGVSFQANSSNVLYELDYNNNNTFVPLAFTLVPVKIELAGAQALADGSFVLEVSAPPGQYTLQTSTNLTDWARAMDFTCTNTHTFLTDYEAARFVRRFYRVVPFSGTAAIALHLMRNTDNLLTNTVLDLVLDGPLSASFRVQTSSDLINWATLTNFPAISVTPLHFRDSSTPVRGSRFYRAVSP